MKEDAEPLRTDRPSAIARSRAGTALANHFALRWRVFIFDCRFFGTASTTTSVRRGAPTATGFNDTPPGADTQREAGAGAKPLATPASAAAASATKDNFMVYARTAGLELNSFVFKSVSTSRVLN